MKYFVSEVSGSALGHISFGAFLFQVCRMYVCMYVYLCMYVDLCMYLYLLGMQVHACLYMSVPVSVCLYLYGHANARKDQYLSMYAQRARRC